MRKPIIKAGDKFNRLTAIKFSHKEYTNQYWLFKCDCGNEKIINANNVKRGETKSCGCLLKENAFKHGMTGNETYKSWQRMKQRCLNKNQINYKNYGEQGITICDRWLNSFNNFYKDMGERPEGKSIDRIDNNGNYTPENCRWADIFQQNNNKRNNHLLTYKGKTQTIAEWAKELNLSYNTLYRKIRNKQEFEKIC